MKMLYKNYTLFFLLLSFHPYAQNNFLAEYRKQKVIVKNKIYNGLKTDEIYSSLANENTKMNILPYYRFTYNGKDTLPNINPYRYLELDSTLFFCSFTLKNSVIGYIEKMRNNYSTRFIYEFDSSEIKKRNRIKMITTVEKFSNDLFFVKFENSERGGGILSIVGFIDDDGRLKFVDSGLHLFNTLTDVIISKYGSIDKYFEIIQEEDIKGEMSKKFLKAYKKGGNQKERIESLSNIIANDYDLVSRYVPKDTAKVISLFANEIVTILKLTIDQKKLLKMGLVSTLEQKEGQIFCPKYFGVSGIKFYEINIYPILNSILTKEQFFNYYKQRKLNEWLANKALNSLIDYYFFTQKMTSEECEIKIKSIFNVGK